MLANRILSACGGTTEEKLYVDDVFQTFLYAGNGSTQTINNGIDLVGKGGLVWLKARDNAFNNTLYDTIRGVNNRLRCDQVNASETNADTLTGFNSNGFSLGGGLNAINALNASFISWTFRKAPKFFDVVTYSGNAASSRAIAHNLGVTPGIIVVKRTDASTGWMVYHRSATPGIYLRLDSLNSEFPSTPTWTLNPPTSSVFFVGDDYWTNGPNYPYVAYLFAHDTSADGIIQCGSFTTDASGNATVNTIGWEPQWGMFKASSGTGDWIMLDQMRGWNMTANDAKLAANTDAAEVTTTEYGNPTATGFEFKGGSASTTYTYTVIRRPNKPPTTGTQVYNAIARTGTGAATTVTGVGFAPDLMFCTARIADTSTATFDRLRGSNMLQTTGVFGEVSLTDSVTSFDNNGISLGTDATYRRVNKNLDSYINHFFKRAPGFFDVVCWKSGSSYTAFNVVQHNLGAPAELVISKTRTGTYSWWTYATVLGTGANCKYGMLNTTDAFTTNADVYEAGTPTTFSTKLIGDINTDHISYLFASFPGISKVGSYTGNGSSQTINCGFTTGARFVLIKRTDSAGDWFVWDTVRGIVAANDPHLSLNTTAAEVTTDDSIDPDASGFIVNQNAATNINVNAASYIFLAIS